LSQPSELNKLKNLSNAFSYAGKFIGTGIQINTFIYTKTNHKKEQKSGHATNINRTTEFCILHQ